MGGEPRLLREEGLGLLDNLCALEVTSSCLQFPGAARDDKPAWCQTCPEPC